MTRASGVQGITETDIADYLANTPAFFERHAELLASVQLTSPHGQRAVSLQERQMELLRDKIRAVEGKLVEMVRNAQENAGIAAKLQCWTRALLLGAPPGELPALLVRELVQLFTVPQGGIRIWSAEPTRAAFAAFAAQPFAQAVSDDVKLFAASLGEPYCGLNAGFEAAGWLDEPAAAMSIAMIPLRTGAGASTFGLLVLASPDAARYSADMGTEFLNRIGELASAALARLVRPAD